MLRIYSEHRGINYDTSCIIDGKENTDIFQVNFYNILLLFRFPFRNPVIRSTNHGGHIVPKSHKAVSASTIQI